MYVFMYKHVFMYLYISTYKFLTNKHNSNKIYNKQNITINKIAVKEKLIKAQLRAHIYLS